MNLFYGLLFGSMFVFGGVVLYSLYWAARTGQFTNLQRGAESIFDADEPVGQTTDGFPKGKSSR
jgi:cbb3-type cytochrome oxidase maturation protein